MENKNYIKYILGKLEHYKFGRFGDTDLWEKERNGFEEAMVYIKRILLQDPHTCTCNDSNCPKTGEYDSETEHIVDCPCKECHIKLG